MKKLRGGGGWQAVRYTWRKAIEVGPARMWKAMRSKNACKTCALGMGGQRGGMTNEAGHFPEFCKKSLQAMASDMQGKIEDRFFSAYSIADLRHLSSRELTSLGRLANPVMAGPGDSHFRTVSWDTALAHVAENLKETAPERSFFYASGRSSNEAGFLLHLFARSHGTNHVNNCSFYCHQASGVGLSDSIGSGVATIALDDLDKCDLLFLIGGNPASNHPRLMTTLMQIRRRGGKVVVVNPLREPGLESFRVPSNVRSMLFGSEIASTYVQPTIGGDIAFLAGVAKVIVETGEVDDVFVQGSTEGFEALDSLVKSLTWEQIEIASGVARAEIESVAQEYNRSERTVFAWCMGVTHHEHGVENVQWIANLAFLRGMVGKEGAGLMPIRGHSNVQGMGSIGVTPAMSKPVLEKLEGLGLKVPTFIGLDTMGSLEASARGDMDFGLCLGGNLYGASPDASFVGEALGKLKTLVYLSTTLNTGHVQGLGRTTVIFPVLARDEDPQSTTQESMFSYVRLSDGGPRRHEGPRSEVEVLAEIAGRALGKGGPLDWDRLRDHDEIRSLVAKTVPGFGQIETIGATKKEFQVPGRVLHQPVFKTPSGRAKFCAHPIPSLASVGDRQLRLMTMRSEGQFNTVVYEEEDLYRGQERRDVVLMNPSDIERLGLKADQRVDLVSEAGTVRGVLVRPFDVAKGCAAMYYPEANALVPRVTDPRSKTPSFKSSVVSVEAAAKGQPVGFSDPTMRPSGSRDKLNAC